MIRIISGVIGAGKTLYSMYLMYKFICLNGYENYLNTCKKIQELNDNGFNFSYPQQKHTTYFNGQAKFFSKGKITKTAYTFNPFYMGLPTLENDVSLFMPGANIVIDEAQRYYNSRMFYLFPDYVSRFFELSRQWGLNITLIAQRSKLIDVNIREIAEEFDYIEDLEVEEDTLGNLLKAVWTIRRFTNNSDLEHYLDGHKDIGEVIKEECTENLYKFYDTCFYRFLFINDRKDQDFLQDILKPFKYSPEICAKLSQVYSATPPSSYYSKKD